MRQPIILGRLAPRNDWEGDDFVPGSGGRMVSCTDTSAGRMVAWATGAVNKMGVAPHLVDRDGKVYRAALRPPDPDGTTLEQARQAIHAVCGRNLLIRRDVPIATVRTHLRLGKGAMIGGRYDALPRAFRHQRTGDFYHRMFASHLSLSLGAVRVWDPLNPDTTAYGRWIPAQAVWDFIATLPEIGYVPLEPL